LAAALLRSKGMVVQATNVRVGRGEIDLVVTDRGVRVAVEVRSITGSRPLLEAFGDAKADQVWRLAGEMRPPCRRVDLVAVRFGPLFVDLHWLPAVA
jgi:Holliday junction resolvase-like predicted endonuclease